MIEPRPESWDSGDIESPFILRRGTSLELLYAAYGQIPQRFALGIATLPLGTRSIRTALLAEQDAFAPGDAPQIPADFVEPGGVNNAQEPSVVVGEDWLDVYYVAIGLTEPTLGFVPGQAPTGIGLRRQRFDHDWTPVNGSDEALLENINIAEVHAVDGALHLYSTSLEDNDNHRGERILWHRSTDGGTTWSEPVAALGFGHGAFDNWGVTSPSLAFDDDQPVLFFSAWEASNEPCAASDRFGMPDNDDDPDASALCLFVALGRAEPSLGRLPAGRRTLHEAFRAPARRCSGNSWKRLGPGGRRPAEGATASAIVRTGCRCQVKRAQNPWIWRHPLEKATPYGKVPP